MAVLLGRFARFGVVGFVATWAAATLAVTAATLDHGARPVAEASGAETTASELDLAADTGTASSEAVPTTTAAPATTTPLGTEAAGPAGPATTQPSTEPTASALPPDYLVTPSSTEAVRTEVLTEVLTEVATAADPVTAQPDFTG